MVFVFVIKKDVKETEGIPVRGGGETQQQKVRARSALFPSGREACCASVEADWPEAQTSRCGGTLGEVLGKPSAS